MKTIHIPAPNPKQALFFGARQRFIGYGGARGGGKSWAMRTKLILLAFCYPRLNVLMLRRTLPELRENHLAPMQRMLYGIAKYNQTERVFLFPNGSRIRLGYCETEKDIYQYQGQEYDVIGVEECTHFSWAQIQFLMTCNRSIREDFRPRMYFTGNPGGVGHNWFKRLFVKREFRDAERPEDYLFIPATVDDNEILKKNNPEYITVLDNLPERLRKAHRYGNWDIFDGQFFDEFVNDENHYADRLGTHVIDPFEVPGSWQIYRSFDWGSAKPFSCGWWAVDYDGRLYRILELYGCKKDEPNTGVKWTAEQVFGEIARIEREHRWLKGKTIHGVADPSIWKEDGGPSLADTAAKFRVYFSPGDNERLPGWMQVRYRFPFDEDGVPMLYVFKTCAAFIRTIPLVQYDENKPEDADSKGEDHVADETRYMCMARPVPPRKAPKVEVYPDDPLDLLHDKRQKRYDPYKIYKL